MELLALIIVLLNFINVSAQSKVDFYKKVIDLYDKADYENAMTQIDLALKQDPDNTDLFGSKSFFTNSCYASC